MEARGWLADDTMGHPWLMVEQLYQQFDALDYGDGTALRAFQEREISLADDGAACDLETVRPELYDLIDELEGRASRHTDGATSIYDLYVG